ATVHHFLPPTFPLEAHVTEHMRNLCATTWKALRAGEVEKMKEMTEKTGKSGVVLFYDEFYYRLFERAHVFCDLFPNMKTRGQVLIMATEFLLSIKGDRCDNKELKILHHMGAKHRLKKGIRPWQFSAYASAFLETIMFWMGGQAGNILGEAWTVVFAYSAEKMLQAFCPNMVESTDFYQNCDVKAAR
ncbi:unnamed protein product, partial [Heterosigma akashiwo]